MRLFVAISLPDEVTAQLRAVSDSLRPLASVKWSSLAHVHITLKFVGERPPEEAERIAGALQTIHFAPFVLSVQGVGWFPSVQRPRVFWAGIAPSAELELLARQIEDALVRLGVPQEERSFSPHVTLARIPRGARMGALRDAVLPLTQRAFGKFAVDAFCLYESRVAAGGHEHVARARFTARGRG